MGADAMASTVRRAVDQARYLVADAWPAAIAGALLIAFVLFV